MLLILFFFFFFFLSFILPFHLAHADILSLACKATRSPDICLSSLTSTPDAQKASSSSDLINVAIQVASQGVQDSHSLAQTLLQKSLGNSNLTEAAIECEYFTSRANARLITSQQALLSADIENAQAWMSAALTYGNDCRSALSYVNTTQYVNQMMQQVENVITLTSNALCMVDAFAIYGEDSTHWEPPNRASLSFSPFHWIQESDKELFEAPLSNLKLSLVVSKDGTGDYTSIQAAVDAAPSYSKERFMIYIKEGIYKEHVMVPDSKTLLAFVGDGMDRTIITGNRNAQMEGVTTYASATVAIHGDGFLGRDMSFENTAGPENHQAVALRVDSDFASFYSCSFLGYQDTLYVHSLRQLYKNCRIEGTIDFIFGNSATVFEKCLILVRPGRPQASTSTVTAQGRTDPAETTALVFQNCIINGTEAYMEGFYSAPKKHLAYLGRPWKLFSRTIFIKTYLGALIKAEGWLPWNGAFALDTLFYGEYMDYGPGANPSARVSWSSQLTQEDALHFVNSGIS